MKPTTWVFFFFNFMERFKKFVWNTLCSKESVYRSGKWSLAKIKGSKTRTLLAQLLELLSASFPPFLGELLSFFFSPVQSSLSTPGTILAHDDVMSSGLKELAEDCSGVYSDDFLRTGWLHNKKYIISNFSSWIYIHYQGSCSIYFYFPKVLKPMRR